MLDESNVRMWLGELESSAEGYRRRCRRNLQWQIVPKLGASNCCNEQKHDGGQGDVGTDTKKSQVQLPLDPTADFSPKVSSGLQKLSADIQISQISTEKAENLRLRDWDEAEIRLKQIGNKIIKHKKIWKWFKL